MLQDYEYCISGKLRVDKIAAKVVIGRNRDCNLAQPDFDSLLPVPVADIPTEQFLLISLTIQFRRHQMKESAPLQ